MRFHPLRRFTGRSHHRQARYAELTATAGRSSPLIADQPTVRAVRSLHRRECERRLRVRTSGAAGGARQITGC